MEGQTQTEGEDDERRQERLMEVCDANKGGEKKRFLNTYIARSMVMGDFILDTERNCYCGPKRLKDHFKVTGIAYEGYRFQSVGVIFRCNTFFVPDTEVKTCVELI